MGFENQFIDQSNIGIEVPDIGQLRQIAERFQQSEDTPCLASTLFEDELNLQGVYESFARLSGTENPETYPFNPGIFPGGLPVGDELRALLNKEPKNNNLQSGVEKGFDSTTFSEYSFGRDQEIKYNGRETFDVPAIRNDFPILQQKVHGKDLIWFDNAATTQKPRSVIDAVTSFYEHDNSNIHRAAHTLAARSTDAYEKAREKVKNFIGASSTDEIIFVRGTTEGINLVAQTFGRKFIQLGDEIIVSTLDHHANIVPWQQLAKEKGAKLLVIPINNNGDVILEDFEKLLGPRTKIVSIAHVNNTFGTILPVKAIIDSAKRWGARVLIDGAQSVAHTPINVQELGADFFVFSGHKIYSPNGIGVVYGRK